MPKVSVKAFQGFCIYLFTCFIIPAFLHADPRDEAQAVLQEGVSGLAVNGSPGSLVVWGAESWVVAEGRPGALVAGGRLGEGRVLAFGHEGYFQNAEASTERFIRQSLIWLTGKKTPAEIRVGVWKLPGLVGHLQKQGFQVSALAPGVWGDVDVLIVHAFEMDDEVLRRQVDGRVRGGAGLLIGAPGWAWKTYRSQGRPMWEMGANLLLAESGIAWSQESAKAVDGVWTVPARWPREAHAGLMLREALAAAPGARATATAPEPFATLVHAAGTLAPDAAGWTELLAVPAKNAVRRYPSESRPLRAAQGLDRLLLMWETHLLSAAGPVPAEGIPAHPSAKDFPGDVPAEAERIEREISCRVAGGVWQSTGLYAPPGAAIQVQVAPGAVGKIDLQIGSHTDSIAHLDAWKRSPRIVRRQTVSAEKQTFANPWGGLVYLIPSEGLGEADCAVHIGGAVEAPYFERGGDLNDWRTRRQAPGPWAELAGRRIVLTMPSEQVRTLDDPESLLETWDRILDLCAELAGIPAERPKPERIVLDRQISAGYMHSGYPIMAHLDQEKNIVDARHLEKEGNWGFYHELGHNHQKPEWTFDGTVEVTCNLFSLYVYEKLCGVKPADYARTSPAARQSRWKKYAPARDFNQWKEDPFLALDMYVQLQEAFGWEAYRKVIAEYRDLPQNQRPRNDADKRDQWMVRFSRTVGRDLGPFFEKWGVPVSEKARAQIRGLPEWMPEGF